MVKVMNISLIIWQNCEFCFLGDFVSLHQSLQKRGDRKWEQRQMGKDMKPSPDWVWLGTFHRGSWSTPCSSRLRRGHACCFRGVRVKSLANCCTEEGFGPSFLSYDTIRDVMWSHLLSMCSFTGSVTCAGSWCVEANLRKVLCVCRALWTISACQSKSDPG